MAQIIEIRRGTRRKSPRSAPTLDLTPMVDLGFLLVTFFMLTTVLDKPQVMPVVMPERHGDPDPVKASTALTLLLAGGDSILYYEGMFEGGISTTRFGAEGLRALLLDKKRRTALQFPEELRTDTLRNGIARSRRVSQLNVIVKPLSASTYGNLVEIFDEMAITGISRYALMEASPEESAHVSGTSE